MAVLKLQEQKEKSKWGCEWVCEWGGGAAAFEVVDVADTVTTAAAALSFRRDIMIVTLSGLTCHKDRHKERGII